MINEYLKILNDIKEDKYKLLYVAPERLDSREFMDLVKDKKNKKGTYIKFLIYNLIIGNEISITKNLDKNLASSDNDKNDISEDEFDDDINNEFD